MEQPKVLVGTPVCDLHEHCLEEYVEGLKSLTYSNMDILLVDNSKDDGFFRKVEGMGIPITRIGWHPNVRERLVRSRNVLRDKMLSEGHDYFLNLEQDIVPPKDIVERLVSHGKDVVTAVYFTMISHGMQVDRPFPVLLRNASPDIPLSLEKGEYGRTRWEWYTEKAVEEPRLMEVDACGMGALLMHRRVLEKVRFSYPEKGVSTAFDDVWFCHKAKLEGFRIFADTSIKCVHHMRGRLRDWGTISELD